MGLIRSKAKLASTMGMSLDKLNLILQLPGAPEYDGGFDADTITQFIEDNAGKVTEGVDAELKRVRIEEIKIRCHRLRRTVEREDGLWVLKSDVAATMDRIFAPLMADVTQKLENEYPSAVAGLGIPEARVYGKKVVDDIRAAHLKFADEWKM